MSEPVAFGDRLAAAFAAYGRLCVGIDPHAQLLESWGLPDSGEGVREFGLRVVDAAAGQIGIVKPQVSFYERHGAAGYAALERVFAEARDAGLIVIADAKRGDIGSTLAGYADAWLCPGSTLEADALTLNPYQGLATLAPVMERAAAVGKGVFVLAATSNPESGPVQTAELRQSSRAGRTIASAMVDGVDAWNRSRPDASTRTLGDAGVVIGATVDLRGVGIDPDAYGETPGLPVLAPGFGHQGGDPAQLGELFGRLAAGAIVNESRSVLAAGPDEIGEAVRRRAGEVGSLGA